MSSSPKTKNEPCANWWPNVSPPYKVDPKMPSPLCTLCANWKRVEDIEDLSSMNVKPCSNYYNIDVIRSSIKNKIDL